MECYSYVFTVGGIRLAPEGAATPVKPACVGSRESPQGDFVWVGAALAASEHESEQLLLFAGTVVSEIADQL